MNTVSTLVSVRHARVYQGWHLPLTALGSQRALFSSKHFVNALIFLSPSSWLYIYIYISACGDNLILKTEEKNSYQPVHLLTFLDLHLKLLDFLLQKN